MIILFVLFLIQFSVASSCLAVNKDQQRDLAARGWNHGPIELKKEVQDTFKCCGFNSTSDSDIPCDVSLLFYFILLQLKFISLSSDILLLTELHVYPWSLVLYCMRAVSLQTGGDH